MGDRVQVHFTETGVWLYSHWDGDNAIEDVRRALAKKWRWDDPEYLARIVFDEMTDGRMDETGYGIGTKQHGDVDRVVEIDTEKGLVRLMEGESEASMEWARKEYGDEIPKWYTPAKAIYEGTFVAFIDSDIDSFGYTEEDE